MSPPLCQFCMVPPSVGLGFKNRLMGGFFLIGCFFSDCSWPVPAAPWPGLCVRFAKDRALPYLALVLNRADSPDLGCDPDCRANRVVGVSIVMRQTDVIVPCCFKIVD